MTKDGQIEKRKGKQKHKQKNGEEISHLHSQSSKRNSTPTQPKRKARPPSGFLTKVTFILLSVSLAYVVALIVVELKERGSLNFDFSFGNTHNVEKEAEVSPSRREDEFTFQHVERGSEPKVELENEGKSSELPKKKSVEIKKSESSGSLPSAEEEEEGLPYHREEKVLEKVPEVPEGVKKVRVADTQVPIPDVVDKQVEAARETSEVSGHKQGSRELPDMETATAEPVRISEAQEWIRDVEEQIIPVHQDGSDDDNDLGKDSEFLLKLESLYAEVEALADEIVSLDPGNQIVERVTPHMEGVLKSLELGHLENLEETILHINIILRDVKERIITNQLSDVLSGDKSENSNMAAEGNAAGNKKEEDLVPVDEVIPDPVYVAPLGEKSNAENSPSREAIGLDPDDSMSINVVLNTEELSVDINKASQKSADEVQLPDTLVGDDERSDLPVLEDGEVSVVEGGKPLEISDKMYISEEDDSQSEVPSMSIQDSSDDSVRPSDSIKYKETVANTGLPSLKEEPLQTEKRDEPLQTEKSKEPLQTEKIELLETEKMEESLQIEKKEPLEIEKMEEPLQMEKEEEPLETEKMEEPLQIEKKKEPLETEKMEEPLQIEKNEEPLETEKMEEPLQIEKKEEPLETEKKKEQLQTKEKKKLLQPESKEKLLQTKLKEGSLESEKKGLSGTKNKEKPLNKEGQQESLQSKKKESGESEVKRNVVDEGSLSSDGLLMEDNLSSASWKETDDNDDVDAEFTYGKRTKESVVAAKPEDDSASTLPLQDNLGSQRSPQGRAEVISEEDSKSPDESLEKEASVMSSNFSHVDMKIDDELDEAEKVLEKDPVGALNIYGSLLTKEPKSAMAAYGRARALDRLAEVKKSNAELEKAIRLYQSLFDLADEDAKLVPLPVLRAAAERAIDRLKFRGYFSKAVRMQQRLLQRFPDDLLIQKDMGVTYLMMNQVKAAQEVFEEILKMWPHDGFSQVHYGFILKTSSLDNTAGAHYLQKGIDSNEEGTQDGRFYYHLGDALQRLNRTEDAYKVYDEGVKKGLFLNRYQRSLYNVDRLLSQPVWTLEETTYQAYFRKIEENWEVIRNEAMALLSLPPQDGFQAESENLLHTGGWKQYELYARGRKITANCVRAPRTCSLIDSFPDAKTCSRGQVKFSVMYPQTHVWPHTGPTNCRLRAHLGLRVPSGLKLRIAQQETTWKEGKFIVFDDSWEHEVWHAGDSYRLVLIIDVWHPDLTPQERNTLPAI